MKKETLQKLTPDEVATLRLELKAERTIAALLHGVKLRGGSFEEFTIIVLQMIIAVAEYDKLENTLSNLDNFELAVLRDWLERKYKCKRPYVYTAGLDVKKDAPRKKRA
jgi:hypothetical protein